MPWRGRVKSSANASQLLALMVLITVAIEGERIRVACHHPAGLKMVSPGLRMNRYGVALANNGNFSKSTEKG